MGITRLRTYDTGDIEWAINIGKELGEMEPNETDKALLILSNYRFFVAHQLGLCLARIRYLETVGPRNQLANERAKYSIAKPWLEAIDNKIAVLKKILDRRTRNATSNRG